MSGAAKAIREGVVLAVLALAGCGAAEGTASPDAGGAGGKGETGGEAGTAVAASPVTISTATRRPRTGTWSVNYWDWMPSLGQPTMVDDLLGTETVVAALGAATPRVGGNSNDTNTPDPFNDAQVDAAIAYARAVGAEPILQVPLIADTTGQPPTAETAAAMVRYANVTMGYGVKYFSVGNEPDLYASQTGYGAPAPAFPGYTAADYCTQARAFVTAMKGVDPTIEIVGPDLSWQYTQYDDWLTPILDGCGDLFDVVSIHWYPNDAQHATVPAAAADGAAFRALIGSVRGLMTSAGAGAKPLAVMEMNVAYDPQPAGGPLSASPGTVPSGLWVADIVGNALDLNLWTIAFWDICDEDFWSDGLLDIPPAHRPRPAYYAYQLYAEHFGPTLVDVVATPAGVSAFASRNQSDDATQVIVVNWNASAAPLAFQVTGPTPAPRSPVFVLPALSMAAVEIPDRGGASAWVYGDAQNQAASGLQPLAASSD